MAKIDLFRYGYDFVKTTYVDSLIEIAELCEFEYSIPVYLAQSLCEILNLNYEKSIIPCQSSRNTKNQLIIKINIYRTQSQPSGW